jgi:hypothetical protein
MEDLSVPVSLGLLHLSPNLFDNLFVVPLLLGWDGILETRKLRRKNWLDRDDASAIIEVVQTILQRYYRLLNSWRLRWHGKWRRRLGAANFGKVPTVLNRFGANLRPGVVFDRHCFELIDLVRYRARQPRRGQLPAE